MGKRDIKSRVSKGNADNDPNSFSASAISPHAHVHPHIVQEITASLPGCPQTTSASCFTTATLLSSPPTPLILLKAIHNKREILGSGVQTFSPPPYHKGPTCPGNIPQITKKADKFVLITSLEQCCLTGRDVKLNTILIQRKWCQGLIFPLQVKRLINMRAGL